MPATLTALDAVLKNVYEGKIESQVNDESRILQFMTKADVRSLEHEGRNIILAVHLSRNVGVKATVENGLLPAAGSQGVQNLTIPPKYVNGRIELTAQLIEQAKTNRGAFTNAMTFEKERLVEDLARQRNRYLFGYGSGVLALANGAGSSTATLVVDAPGGVAGSVNGTRFLQAGMVIAFHDATTPTTVDALGTISTIDSGTNATLAAAKSWDDDAFITLGATDGSANEGSYNAEPMGLLGIVDATTYVTAFHGLNRSTYPQFGATVETSVGTLTPDRIYRGIMNARLRGGKNIDVFVTDDSVVRELIKLTEADRRYTGPQLLNPDAGVSTGVFQGDASFGGKPVLAEKDAPYGFLFGINKKSLIWLPLEPGKWVDEDGSILSRSGTKDNFEARYRIYENFSTNRGNANVRFSGITSTVTSGVTSY